MIRRFNTTTVIAVTFVLVGISVELDRIDPLIKEPGQDTRAASKSSMVEGDEEFPEKRHQVRDEEDHPGLGHPHISYEDIEMSGALPIGDTDQARDSSGASDIDIVDMTRDDPNSDDPTEAVEGPHQNRDEASRSISAHRPADEHEGAAHDMLWTTQESALRITRRHSG